MEGNAYWKTRQARLMYARMDEAEVSAAQVARIYAKASADIVKRMRDIFRVYQEKWNLTEKEARQLLSRMDGTYNPESLRRAISIFPDGDLKQQMLRDLETPAYQARLRRLQELQDQIDQMMADVYLQDRKKQRQHYIQTGTDAYYRGIYDVQRQVGFQFSFAHIDQKAFDRLLKSKWSGKNYSGRIWDNTRHVAETVKDELMLELLTGKRLDDCAEAIQHRFQVGAYQSRRIIRTESNFVSGQMQLQAYRECESDYYEYVATLDSRTDEECGALDGKRFRLEDAQPGVNMHPMHPHCRCTTVIAMDDDMKTGLERRARDPKTGKNIKVPASTNYMQWARDNGLKVREKKIVQLPKSTKSRTKANSNISLVGHINKDIYRCITPDIPDDEVIITNNQISHIKEGHPDSAERVFAFMEDVLKDPDYIFEDKHENSGLVVKKIRTDENMQLVLKIATSRTHVGYKNSIISGWMISDKRLKRYLKKKKVIYRK